MIKKIIKADNDESKNILTTKSVNSIIREDRQLYQDLIDTAEHNRDKCVGLASVQIGVPKRVIAVLIEDKFNIFINPLIVERSKEVYESEEGCLSLEGTRKTTRNSHITLLYTTTSGKTKKAKFSGFVAQIIQHEVDHCNGILI